ncbi:unnamed protein product [Hymenolepis diminuta]|uniref:Uncharacterized protein n=2 Tax=Hymenolepis diminuta TaxID=6216 RepID=A0A564YK11_HYMDI|nr:unnamed protein product [Hymenolepis diminuta]
MEDSGFDFIYRCFGNPVLINLLQTDSVTFDYKRCCKILFTYLQKTNAASVKQSTLNALWELFARMSDDNLAEFRANLHYMRCLIKCLAEIYLPEHLVFQWLDEFDRGPLFYLRNFSSITLDDPVINYSLILRQFIGNNYWCCLRFVEAGGFPVLRFIIQNLAAYGDMNGVRRQLNNLLESIDSILRQYQDRT